MKMVLYFPLVIKPVRLSYLFLTFLFISNAIKISSQVGLSVSPPKIYFEQAPETIGSNSIKVTNASKTNTLDLSVSIGDWAYNELGENITYQADTLSNSCASWFSIDGNSYFSLKPEESREIQINLNIPEDFNTEIPVRTMMMYITQTNPFNSTSNGSPIKISVRSGIKIYYRMPTEKIKSVNIENVLFDKDTNKIILFFKPNGNTWIDGTVSTYLFNKDSGKENELNDLSFYSLPGDKRRVEILLPQNIDKGKYTATILIDYGDKENIEAAELSFNYD